MTELPRGFVLDQQDAPQQAVPASPPGLPPGFQIDAQPAQKPWSASVLPLSEDAQGKVQFDSNAGLLGSLKRAVMLPGDVATGKVDPRSEQGISRAMEMAGVVSPVNPAIRAGGNAPGSLFLRGTQEPKVQPPTADALRAASGEGYERARSMGVDYSSTAVRDAVTQLRTGLERDGILAELAPKSFGIIRKLEEPPAGSVLPLSGLEAARRAFQHAGKDFANPTDQLAAKRIVSGLDDFMAKGDPGSVVAGPAAAASKTISDARGNYAAAMRSDRLAGIEEGAELRAAAANSGRNGDNALRSRIASLLTSDKQKAGFSQVELAALEEIVRGTPVRNTARNVGNLLGGGGGLGSIVTGAAGGTAGGLLGGPVGAVAGAALPAMGLLAKSSGNAMTSKAVTRADEMVRRRSPLFEQMKSEAPLDVISPEQRAMLVRGLLSIPMQDRQPKR